MGRTTNTFKKRKGFIFGGRKCPETSVSSTLVAAPISSSAKKIDLDNSYQFETEETSARNIILNLNLLSLALNKSVLCKKCKKSGIQIMISGQETGLAVKLSIYCEICSFEHKFSSSEARKYDGLEVYNVNTRFVYALR